MPKEKPTESPGDRIVERGSLPTGAQLRLMAPTDVRRSLDLFANDEGSRFRWTDLARFMQLRALGLTVRQSVAGVGWSFGSWNRWRVDDVHGPWLQDLEQGARAIGATRYAERLCELSAESKDDRVRATTTTFLLQHLSDAHSKTGGESAGSSGAQITVRVETMDGVVLPPGVSGPGQSEEDEEKG